VTERYLTIVFRDPTQDEVAELVYHPKASAMGWSHVLDERDQLKWRLQKMMHETADTAN